MKPVLVAVTLPRHPTTGNVYRSGEEASALSLALSLGRDVTIAHAGREAGAEDLRAFAGFGQSRIVLVRTDDAVGALAALAREVGAGLVLTGTEAQQGRGSGQVPYRLADALGWPVFADTLACEADAGGWQVATRLGDGRRSRWRARHAAVLAVRSARVPHRIQRFATARSDPIEVVCRPGGPAREPVARVAARRRAARLDQPSDMPWDMRIRSLTEQAAPSAAGRNAEACTGELAAQFLEEVRRLGFARER